MGGVDNVVPFIPRAAAVAPTVIKMVGEVAVNGGVATPLVTNAATGAAIEGAAAVEVIEGAAVLARGAQTAAAFVRVGNAVRVAVVGVAASITLPAWAWYAVGGSALLAFLYYLDHAGIDPDSDSSSDALPDLSAASGAFLNGDINPCIAVKVIEGRDPTSDDDPLPPAAPPQIVFPIHDLQINFLPNVKSVPQSVEMPYEEKINGTTGAVVPDSARFSGLRPGARTLVPGGFAPEIGDRNQCLANDPGIVSASDEPANLTRKPPPDPWFSRKGVPGFKVTLSVRYTEMRAAQRGNPAKEPVPGLHDDIEAELVKELKATIAEVNPDAYPSTVQALASALGISVEAFESRIKTPSERELLRQHIVEALGLLEFNRHISPGNLLYTHPAGDIRLRPVRQFIFDKDGTLIIPEPNRTLSEKTRIALQTWREKIFNEGMIELLQETQRVQGSVSAPTLHVEGATPDEFPPVDLVPSTFHIVSATPSEFATIPRADREALERHGIIISDFITKSLAELAQTRGEWQNAHGENVRRQVCYKLIQLFMLRLASPYDASKVMIGDDIEDDGLIDLIYNAVTTGQMSIPELWDLLYKIKDLDSYVPIAVALAYLVVTHFPPQNALPVERILLLQHKNGPPDQDEIYGSTVAFVPSAFQMAVVEAADGSLDIEGAERVARGASRANVDRDSKYFQNAIDDLVKRERISERDAWRIYSGLANRAIVPPRSKNDAAKAWGTPAGQRFWRSTVPQQQPNFDELVKRKVARDEAEAKALYEASLSGKAARVLGRATGALNKVRADFGFAVDDVRGGIQEFKEWWKTRGKS